MASKGRTKAFRKDSVIFKVEQMEWLSEDYYIYGTSIPEKIRCHGCRCVSNTIYPLENECQGHGLCKDCKKFDFTCRAHGGHVTAEALRNAVGQTNYAAKRLRILCLFCGSNEAFLNLKDHMYKKHY
uniref:Uncharacterized protein n=1 Tax=Ixodes ricinus TaxID=34613 RepID=A0A0K8RCZ8_IXORI